MTRPSRLAAFRASSAFAPLAVGVIGLVFTGALIWIPAPWYDEAATISAATRSIPQLFAMLQNVDAVHGGFYLLMHAWFSVVPYSPFTLRLPSAIATALAAALLVALVRRLGTARLGVVTGIVFVLMPRVTWMATEGRSYALTALLAVALTSVFVVARGWGGRDRTRHRLIWIAYGLLAAASTIVFLDLGLLVIAHGITALLLRDRRTLAGWLPSAAVGGLLALPVALTASHQTGQVSWIVRPDWATVDEVFSGQWFLGNPPFAGAAWIALIIGVVLLARGRSELAVVVLPWFAFPTIALLLESAVATPLYSARYLTFAAPAAATVIAVAITRITDRRVQVAALTALLVLTLPTWVRQREPDVKQNSSWGEVAALIATQRASEPAGQRDAVIYGSLSKNHPESNMSMLALAYPREFAGLVDVRAGVPASERGQLWESRIPLAQARDRLAGAEVVWVVTNDKGDWPETVGVQLAEWGYRDDADWRFTGIDVIRFVRD